MKVSVVVELCSWSVLVIFWKQASSGQTPLTCICEMLACFLRKTKTYVSFYFSLDITKYIKHYCSLSSLCCSLAFTAASFVRQWHWKDDFWESKLESPQISVQSLINPLIVKLTPHTYFHSCKQGSCNSGVMAMLFTQIKTPPQANRF